MTSEETVRIGYRAPYRFDKLLAFFGRRALEGVELVEGESYARTVRLALPGGDEAQGWLRVTDDPSSQSLILTISDSLINYEPQVSARIRRQFDVETDPQAVHEGLRLLDEVVPGAAVEGTRVPGCFDSFETACRAVLGQQVTVAAAGRFAARIVESYGSLVETGIAGLTHAFPTPAEVLAIDDVETAFGTLGVIRSRSRTIVELARLIEAGELSLCPEADAKDQMERLLAIRGIGPWSANYLAMRTLGHPDAFMETDVGVAQALPELTPRERRVLAERWRPWRSYANVCLWNSLENGWDDEPLAASVRQDAAGMGRRREIAVYYSTEYDSPVGRLTLASDGQAICGLWLEGQKYHGAGIAGELERNDQASGFDELRAWLDAYFAGARPALEKVPLAPIGSEFQRLVWRLLTKIPYGEVTTYGALAEQIAQERGGRRTAPLAVGGAVGHNPISIVIPCHRVVGSDGSLTGYAGGLTRKMWLLEHEGVKADGLYVPKRGTAL